jgi:hypothetical protein
VGNPNEKERAGSVIVFCFCVFSPSKTFLFFFFFFFFCFVFPLASYSNKIGCEGAKALGLALPSLKKLMALHLGDNQISADGMRALAPGLVQVTYF